MLVIIGMHNHIMNTKTININYRSLLLYKISFYQSASKLFFVSNFTLFQHVITNNYNIIVFGAFLSCVSHGSTSVTVCTGIFNIN